MDTERQITRWVLPTYFSFVHPLQLFSVIITSHEMITHKLESWRWRPVIRITIPVLFQPFSNVWSMNRHHLHSSCWLLTDSWHHLQPAHQSPNQRLLLSLQDRHPQEGVGKGGSRNKTSPGRVLWSRAEWRQCSPGDCTDEFNHTGFCTKLKECGFTHLYSIQLTFCKLPSFLCQLSCFFPSLHTRTHNKNLHSCAPFVSNHWVPKASGDNGVWAVLRGIWVSGMQTTQTALTETLPKSASLQTIMTAPAGPFLRLLQSRCWQES